MNLKNKGIVMLDLIFREYDIRGLYPDELNEKSVKAIGYALGLIMKEKKCKKVSVGYDARYSATELTSYFKKIHRRTKENFW